MRELKLVVVDDHEDDLILFREMLDDAGYRGEIVSFGGADRARDYLEQMQGSGGLDSLGVIFLDLNMPIKNGFEFLEELMAHPEYNKIPVIMVSGSRRESEREMALLKGAIAYVTKPVEFGDMVSAIQGLSIKWSLS